MVLLSEQCEQRILGLRQQERAEITALKQERQHLQQVIESMKEQQTTLQTQVGNFTYFGFAPDWPKTKYHTLSDHAHETESDPMT